MAEVEDQRMAQPVGPQVKGGVKFKGLVEPLVDIEGVVEIGEDFGPLLVRIALVEDDGSGVADIHGNPLGRKGKARLLYSRQGRT